MTDTASSIDQTLLEERALLPFLPVIYVAWSDGDLTPEELDRLRQLIHAHDDLDPAAQARVERWLDPTSPPTAEELARLLATIRRGLAGLPHHERTSLAELGLELARGSAIGGTATALAEIEAALGPVGREVSRELEGVSDEAPETRRSSVDPAALTRLLDGDYRAVRERVRARLRQPEFRYRYGLSTAEHRELTFEWIKLLAQDGYGALAFPVEHGGRGDLGAFLAAGEILATHDHSLTIKFGVQFGLFGGSIALLGTERHHRKYLRDVASVALPGCFAMSELGHGSNVRDILTEARYDRATGEFVVHTPSELARKEWIGNAARHGRLATVFAQLIVDDACHGVHALLVPIRGEDGQPLPGVRIGDDGVKAGLNGVDNGRLAFDRVRVPRENLLNRYGDVSEDGTYTSPIASSSRRFFTMLGTLVGGRVSIGACSVSAAKVGLAVAIRYGARRRQFGPAGRGEVPILDYLTHQRRLFPALATTYALDFALKYLVRRFVSRGAADEREVEALAAGFKAYGTWHTSATLQECRECCGGQGYLVVNRIAQLRADLDIYTTFEGDNTVLMQLLAKGLLTEWRQQFGAVRFAGVVRYLGRRASQNLRQLNPLVTRRTDEAHLRDADFQLDVFRYREERLLASAARRLKALIDDGRDSFDAFTETQDHLLALARAHVERVVLEQFQAGILAQRDPALARLLARLRDLFALSRLEADAAWLLASGVFEAPKARAVRALVNRLCAELRPDAVALVDGFGIPDEVLAAPIAFSAAPAADESGDGMRR